MSTNGPGSVGSNRSLGAAARQAAASAHHQAGCQPPVAGQRARTVVIGGGASYSNGPGAPSPDRLAEAARGARPCAPQPPAPPGSGARAVARPVNPALATLAVLLGDATPPPQPPSLGQRISAQLSLLLQATTARIAALMSSGEGAAVRGGGDAALADAARPDAPASQQQPAPPPRVPLQPPAPTLTLDPSLGTIVHDDGPGGQPPLGTTPTLDRGDPTRQPLLPSSWVPVTGALGRLGVTGRDGALRLLAGIDRLVKRSRLSRLQWLALTLIAPAIVAFLIDAVVSMLAGN